MSTRNHLGVAIILALSAIAGCAEQRSAPKPPPASKTVDQRPSASLPESQPFKVELELLVAGDAFSFAVFFNGHHAVEFDPEDQTKVSAVYNLNEMSWRDFAPPRTVTLADCEAWGRSSAELSRRSLGKSSDANLNKFLELSLEPRFETTAGDGTMTLRNAVLTYRVSNALALDAAQRKRFFAYDRLNAYRKAMTDRKLPPFPQLAVDDELEKRGFVPGTIELTIATPNGDVNLTLNARASEMTPDETERVSEAIRRAKAT